MIVRSRFMRDLLRAHAQELARRDEMIQSLLDRIQHPDRTPIWREPVDPLEPVRMDENLPVYESDML